MRPSRLGVVAVLGALLAGCGLTSSPADGITFTAPPGWQGSPGIMGFMQFWKPPGSSDQVLMLFRSPKQVDPNDVFTNAKLKDTRIERKEEIEICGHQPAIYFAGEGSSSSGGGSRESDLQMVMSNANGASYFAMYVYPIGDKPDALAVAALRELCAKP